VLKRPLFIVSIAFAVGIMLSGVFRIPVPIALAVLAFIGLCSVVRRAYIVALLMLIVAAGMLRYQVFTTISPDDVSKFITARPSAIVGRVASDVDLRPDRVLLPLEVRAVRIRDKFVPANGRIMLTDYRPTDTPDWKPPGYGDVLLVHARPSSPAGASNPGAFSRADYLARQRIYAVAYARRSEQIERLPQREASFVVTLAIRAKDHLSDSIASSMPPDEAATVIGMDLGTYAALPDRLLANFQRTGTMHLLAASGFNCALLVAVFGFLLATVLRIPRQIVSPATIAILLFYMLAVGASPSIVRATVMATLWLLGRILNRPADTLNLLFASAIVILAINPADLFDAGFQLSFAAVLALILALPVITETARKWNLDPGARKVRPKWPMKAVLFVVDEGWQGITATTAATLGTAPISAQYFNYVSLVSIVVNAIVAAAILPIFVIGLLMPLVHGIPFVGDAFAFAGTMITRMALSAINWFGELPFSCISVTSPGTVGIIGYYVVFAAVLAYAHSRVPTKKRPSSP
jgi:competence protein ComEC